MKKPFIFTVGVLFCSTLLGQSLTASFSYVPFYSPDGPYIETYLSVHGESVVYDTIETNNLQGAVEAITIFKQNDSIIFADKYKLSSPLININDSTKPDFLDQFRISIAEGVYQLEFELRDVHELASENTPLTYKEILVINFPKDSLCMSGIELIESFQKATNKNKYTKSGIDLIPYPTNYYPPTAEVITFYAELYNMEKVLGKGSEFLITYALESQDNELGLEAYTKFQKQMANSTNVVFNQFSIKDLPSGNYNIVIEVKNNENESILIKKQLIQRSNPRITVSLDDLDNMSIQNSFAGKYSDKDILYKHIQSLSPISSSKERTFAFTHLEKAEHELMQKYFLHFWEQRDQLAPEQAWNTYQELLAKVDKEFGTPIREGYETDRGRVYLQYGQANTVAKMDQEPTSYPYEIWHYYKLEKQSNVKFIFYNPDLVTNDYELLHSTYIGEIFDVAWHYKLNKRDTAPGSDLNRTTSPNHYGTRLQDIYNDPR